MSFLNLSTRASSYYLPEILIEELKSCQFTPVEKIGISAYDISAYDYVCFKDIDENEDNHIHVFENGERYIINVCDRLRDVEIPPYLLILIKIAAFR